MTNKHIVNAERIAELRRLLQIAESLSPGMVGPEWWDDSGADEGVIRDDDLRWVGEILRPGDRALVLAAIDALPTLLDLAERTLKTDAP